MSTLPAIFLAFANDSASPLPALADEARRIKSALKASLHSANEGSNLIFKQFENLSEGARRLSATGDLPEKTG